jgi:hypothetical protein
MQKFIKFIDNTQYEISPLSYAEFMSLNLWNGASDIAFKQWLNHNNLIEVDDFNADALEQAVILINLTTRKYEVNPKGDEITWVELAVSTIGNYPLRKTKYYTGENK